MTMSALEEEPKFTTQLTRRPHMSAISIIGSGGMAAAIGGLAAKGGHQAWRRR